MLPDRVSNPHKYQIDLVYRSIIMDIPSAYVGHSKQRNKFFKTGSKFEKIRLFHCFNYR